ncbi:hypothetical protein [Allochromatium palmeri]|uniref:Uncharacterized protein n=1 Tax=Allochromatium palmeri TaxID=231048 RepID=A0A6N8EKD1_9GAMM|nr:hypothetical protein [Allochromatium palmeri]MTW22804.1 hypothetical protein [Allochromatium palmeri]
MTIERLELAAKLVADPDLQAWLSGAARKIAHGLPADQALDLSGPGARREADRLMWYAARILADDDRLSLWSAAGRIAAWRRGGSCVPGEVARLLESSHHAASVPSTQRGVYRRLTDIADARHEEVSP